MPGSRRQLPRVSFAAPSAAAKRCRQSCPGSLAYVRGPNAREAAPRPYSPLLPASRSIGLASRRCASQPLPFPRLARASFVRTGFHKSRRRRCRARPSRGLGHGHRRRARKGPPATQASAAPAGPVPKGPVLSIAGIVCTFHIFRGCLHGVLVRDELKISASDFERSAFNERHRHRPSRLRQNARERGA